MENFRRRALRAAHTLCACAFLIAFSKATRAQTEEQAKEVSAAALQVTLERQLLEHTSDKLVRMPAISPTKEEQELFLASYIKERNRDKEIDVSTIEYKQLLRSGVLLGAVEAGRYNSAIDVYNRKKRFRLMVTNAGLDPKYGASVIEWFFVNSYRLTDQDLKSFLTSLPKRHLVFQLKSAWYVGEPALKKCLLTAVPKFTSYSGEKQKEILDSIVRFNPWGFSMVYNPDLNDKSDAAKLVTEMADLRDTIRVAYRANGSRWEAYYDARHFACDRKNPREFALLIPVIDAK